MYSCFLLLAIGCAVGCMAMSPSVGMSQYNVVWSHPTPEPGVTSEGRETFQGAMPLGNGALTALSWPNTTTGGVDMYIGHQDAMSSWTELFKIAHLQIALSPNPFNSSNASSFFLQELDFDSATMNVFVGGTSKSDFRVKFSVWVDANQDQFFVQVVSGSTEMFTFDVSVSSVRPSDVWVYNVDFGPCHSVSSQPDVFVDPLPRGGVFDPAPHDHHPFHHATGHRRPLRRLTSPTVGGFQNATVIIFHRNNDSDGLTIQDTLTVQGCGDLVDTTPDYWRDLQFGMAVDAGMGPYASPLTRVSPRRLVGATPQRSFQLRGTVLAVQTRSAQEWLDDLSVTVAESDSNSRPAHVAFWSRFWNRSFIYINASDSDPLTQMYIVTRFTQSIQSRNTKWPIKFNGMAFVAAMPPNADFRQWGPSNWWQNTRLPYGAMLTAGDFDEMQVLMDYLANMEVFLSQRTLLYWSHPGMWTTETHHLSGAYDQSDYGCSRPAGYPTSLMTSGWIHIDQGGDSGTGEYPLMVLDYFLWTNNTARLAPYLKIATQAANYFMYHYKNSTADGKVIVWPAQVLETWWCTYTVGVGFENCCEDDSPTISAMQILFEKLLSLPAELTTETERETWRKFLSLRVPSLPLGPNIFNKTVILPARVLSSGGKHNDEGPELYPIHPHRVFTKGRSVAANQSIDIAAETVASSPFAYENSGWNYGINAAALIGHTKMAQTMVLERARTQPAAGYRWPGFAPHEQDFDPSADHFANMNRCLQDMLLQSGDNGFVNTTIVLFPAWPCEWDVHFKLWGPLNTSVEVEYVNGSVKTITVVPQERRSSVVFASCV